MFISCNNNKVKTYKDVYGSYSDTSSISNDSSPTSMNQNEIMSNDDYCKSISSNGEVTSIFKAEVTDNNILIIGVDRVGNANFDYFCEEQLKDAWKHGVRVDGCFAVDVKDSQFQDGAVVGERIGHAYK